jgi:c-di-GMP-binding flagellar brake protein YcgR
MGGGGSAVLHIFTPLRAKRRRQARHWRRAPRFVMAEPVEVELRAARLPQAAMLLNVSELGACVRLNCPLQVGEQLVLRMRLRGGERLSARATVVRAAKERALEQRYGVRFHDMPQAQRERLGAHLRERVSALECGVPPFSVAQPV